MTSAFSWQNSAGVCFASFCTPRSNFSVTPGYLLTFYFAFQFPMMKRTSFLVLVVEGVVELVSFSFFGISRWSIDSDCCVVEWFALETNRDLSVIFEVACKYDILDSFVDYEGYSISSKGFLPTVVDINSSRIKFSHPHLF